MKKILFSFRHAEFEMVVGYAKGEKVRRTQKRKTLNIERETIISVKL